MHKALAVVGPTSSGKSDVAVEIAHQVSGEVVSADSRQIYRGLDLTTGKITEAEMKGVPHHLIDIRDPMEVYSAGEFRIDTLAAFKDIASRGNVPILCGGTGFFVSSVTENIVFPSIPANPQLRKALSQKSTDDLVRELASLDPNRAGVIDTANRVRLIRAIEIASALGHVPPPKKEKKRYDFLKVGLMLPQDELRAHITQRLEKRLDAGMIEEVEMLVRQQKVTLKRLKELGLECKYVALLLEGAITEKAFREKLLTASFQYAKRQMTWFKCDNKIQWFHPDQKERLLSTAIRYLD